VCVACVVWRSHFLFFSAPALRHYSLLARKSAIPKLLHETTRPGVKERKKEKPTIILYDIISLPFRFQTYLHPSTSQSYLIRRTLSAITLPSNFFDLDINSIQIKTESLVSTFKQLVIKYRPPYAHIHSLDFYLLTSPPRPATF